MPILRRLATAFALSSALVTPLAADTDPQPSLLEFFSINRLGTFYANLGIAALRTQMELEYEFLSTDLMRGTISISGITARPQLPYDQARQCVITVDRAVLNTDVAEPFEVASEANLNLIGAKANSACLPPEAAMGMRATGLTEVSFDQFKIRAAYHYPTGETSVDAAVVMRDMAALDFTTSGMILPRLNGPGPSEPAFRVMRAVVSLKDMGAWGRLSALLPENFRNAETIKAIGSEQITQFLSEFGTRQVTAVERNFVTQLMDRVGDYINDPGELTIEARLPETGIVIEPEVYNSEPQALIAALALEARVAPLARSRILDGQALAALQSPGDLDADTLLALARALLNGDGVPQTPALVPDLLVPAFEDPARRPEASELISRALAGSDPANAYGYALIAAAGGVNTAVPLLDRLEAQMTTTQVLDIQDQVQGDLLSATQATTEDDPRALRRLALAYLAGSGVVRSYPQAYYFALLAEAAGDIGATALKEEINDRFAARGDEVQKAWAEASASIQELALNDWISGGLGARYKRN